MIRMWLIIGALPLFLSFCEQAEDPILNSSIDLEPTDIEILEATFGDNINWDDLPNYAAQDIPDYIDKDNTDGNEITDLGATLGRVLFYDKNLSVDGTVSCSSCHKQAFAFGDDDIASSGVNGLTGRHSMRLVNSRFSEEERFFWDERANSLEAQTTQPIQDHIEMGFSGEDGNPDFDVLIEKLEAIDYYQVLFTKVYGDANVTEERTQLALAQFIRSIQSFDSRYDEGIAIAGNENRDFPNFTDQENTGKDLFMRRAELNNAGLRFDGGLGCGVCHKAPEFDIDPDSRNNGHISSIDGGTDTEVTRAPTLRDLFNTEGELNGPLMHDGAFATLEDALTHYNEIDRAGNNNLDRRLRAGQNETFNLNMTQEESDAVVAFIKTLSGNNVYEDPKWSDPFN